MKVRKLSCPNCNASVQKGQASCEYCGATLDFVESEPKVSQDKPTIVNATINVTQPVQPVVDEVALAEEINYAKDHSISESEMELAFLAEKKEKERKHRIVSSIVSGVTGVAGVVSGIILMDIVSYIGIALIVLGILCLCKIFYTFMRTTYSMSPAGYTYSGIICTLICGFGIYGGVELIKLSPTIDGKLTCVIPFLLAGVSLSYFVTKTVYYIREKRR